MNRSPQRTRHSHIKPIALAIALALPSAAALAQPFSDVVTTRATRPSLGNTAATAYMPSLRTPSP